MTLSLMEDIHHGLKEKVVEMNLYIITPRNLTLFSEFSEFCTFSKKVHLIEASRRNISGLFNLVPFIFSKNYVITPPTPGKLPLKTKIFAKLLSLRNSSKLRGFDDGKRINTYLYDNLIPFTDNILFFELLNKILDIFSIKKRKKFPILDYNLSINTLDKYRLKENEYIVIHPFGSSESRSILGDELLWLIKTIRSIDGLKVVVTGGFEDKSALESTTKDIEIIHAIGLNMIELHEILKGAKLFIGVDTGTTHMAAFLRKKSLVIAHHGNPQWLPYYNDNATILFNIETCIHDVHIGRDHLESCRKSQRPLVRVSRKTIEDGLKEICNG